jgi:hypothetical protein
MKKKMINPVRPNCYDDTTLRGLIDGIGNALNSNPVNFDEINTVLYIINSPSFKYPVVEKCCKTCTADEKGERWKKAINQIKGIEGMTDMDEIKLLYEISRFNLFAELQ